MTPPGGSLASTDDVLVAASLVLDVPPFAAFVLPVLLVPAAFVVAGFSAASSAGVGLGWAVSAGEASDAVHGENGGQTRTIQAVFIMVLTALPILPRIYQSVEVLY